MKFKTLSTILLAGTLFGGCQNDMVSSVGSGYSDDHLTSDSFSVFVQSIPYLPANFELTSNDEFQHVELTSKFIPERASLIGKLPSVGNYEFIVYSYSGKIERPILEVYTSDGIKINQQELFSVGWCPTTIPEYYSAQLSEDGTTFYRETLCVDDHTEGFTDTIVLKDLILPEM